MSKSVALLITLTGAAAVTGGVALAAGSAQPAPRAAGQKVTHQAAAKLAVPKTFTLSKADIDAISAEPDGTLRLRTDGQEFNPDPDSDGELIHTSHGALRTYSAAGVLQAKVPVPATPSGELPGFGAFAYTPSGSVEAFDFGPLKGKIPTTVNLRVVSRDRGGKVVGTDVLPLKNDAGDDGGIDAGVDHVVVGPTGAVVLEGLQAPVDPKSDNQASWLAFRPAGAAHFGAPIALTDGSANSFGFQVFATPDGGALVLGSGNGESGAFVRRVDPAGALGPAIPISFPSTLDASMSATVGPTGTLLVAFSSRPHAKHGGPPGGLYLATLAAGSSTPTAPVLVPSGADSPEGSVASIELGPDDHATITVARTKGGFNLLEGSPTAPVVTRSVPGRGYSLDNVLVAPNGATTLLWDHDSSGEPFRSEILASYRPAGGTFGPAVQLTPRSLHEADFIDAAVTASGNVALVYGDSERNRSFLAPAIWPRP